MATIKQKDSACLSYPYGEVSSEEKILSGVLNALHHHCGVPQERLHVEVHDGHAVLIGAVVSELERELAECTAAAAPGVIDVTNKITVEN